MDRPSRPRRSSAKRPQRVAALVARLRQAIQDEPLLIRLPSVPDLGRLLQAPTRELRDALAELTAEGLLRSFRREGYRVVRRPTARTARLTTIRFAGPIRTDLAGFGQYVALGADARCRELGLKFHFHHLLDDQWSEHLAAAVADEPVAGVGWLIEGCPSQALACQWLNEYRRLLLIDFRHPQVPLPAAMLNAEGAAILATDHLHSLGHRTVAVLCRTLSPILPLLVFHLQDRGFQPTVETAYKMFMRELGELIGELRRWVNNWKNAPAPPTAVVVHDLTVALVLLDVCRSGGIDVPGDLSLLAVGSEYGHSEPPVTLACTGKAQALGRLAVDTLTQPDVMQTRPLETASASLERPGLTTRRPRRRRR